MKVLSIAHSEVGGGIETVFRVNNSINRADVKLIKAFRPTDKKSADINLKTINDYKNPVKKLLAYFFIPSNYFKISNFLKQNPVDIIHIHSNVSLSLSVLAAIKNNKGDAKVINTSHGYGLICPIYSCYNYKKKAQCYDCVFYGKEHRVIKNKCDKRGRIFSVLRFIDFFLRKKISGNYNMFDYIITPSEHLKKILLKSRHNFKNIKVIPNPIEMEENLSDLDSKQDKISYVGRFSEEKNVGMLIDAFALAKEKNPNLHLNILGGGPEKDNYIKKIKEHNLQTSIFVSEKFLGRDELLEKITNSKILVLPSAIPETFGLVIFEGIRLGLIPICLDIGAQSENIKKIGLGLLYQRNDPEQLELSITKIIRNYDDEVHKIKEANKKIDKNFSVGVYHQNIIELYRNAIS
ncbi:glycosyltransferase family 4 protein [Virgibacillus dokdonensis]|uniref:glycosyltransferase family 4 protein n=1 Tax=Virgibacillus dokdonensis TaxID=302167 RepID=UPI00098B51CB|nr:glycosyltransferase family 4 protein [Virgibacillus dokdonensis]